jgi:hypothetical protein
MTGFFIVKGELAAWALGLDQDELVPVEDTLVLHGAPEAKLPRRRKRRLGHEAYRQPMMRRRELVER